MDWGVACGLQSHVTPLRQPVTPQRSSSGRVALSNSSVTIAGLGRLGSSATIQFHFCCRPFDARGIAMGSALCTVRWRVRLCTRWVRSAICFLLALLDVREPNAELRSALGLHGYHGLSVDEMPPEMMAAPNRALVHAFALLEGQGFHG